MDQNSSKKNFLNGFLAGFAAAAAIAFVAFMAYSSSTTPVSSAVSSYPQSSSQSQASATEPHSSSSSKAEPIDKSSSQVPSSSPENSGVKKDYPGEFAVLRDSKLINSPQDEQIQLLYSYFDDCYRSLGKLRASDITDWFLPQNAAEQENMLLNQMTLQILCAVRAERETDLSFDNYQYGITITGFEQLPDGRAEIVLLEDSACQFAFLEGEKSYLAGIEHTFLLTPGKEEGKWLISKHTSSEDMMLRVWDIYCEKRGSAALADIEKAPAIFEKVYDEIVNAAAEAEKQRVSQLAEYDEKGGRIPANSYNWKYNYDRSGAVSYAELWAGEQEVLRNEEWPLYDDNCQNYVSQCLFAGGIPMDCTGSAQWKWCGDAVNGLEKMTGRSLSWSGVVDFYNYCKYNDNRAGLVAQVDANLCNAAPGDVIQLGSSGKWHHSAIITEVIFDGDEPIDFMLCSNSAERLNFPASAYPCSEMRLIKIYGYN